MKRLIPIILTAVIGAFALAGTASAQPVAAPAARHAIVEWWRGKQPPTILWCAEKRYGTICGVQSIASKEGFQVRERDAVWVTRMPDGVGVVKLWATVRIRLAIGG